MGKYDKLFIRLDKEDMSKLRSGRLVVVDGIEDVPSIVICSEEGYDNFLEFWNETDNES